MDVHGDAYTFPARERCDMCYCVWASALSVLLRWAMREPPEVERAAVRFLTHFFLRVSGPLFANRHPRNGATTISHMNKVLHRLAMALALLSASISAHAADFSIG